MARCSSKLLQQDALSRAAEGHVRRAMVRGWQEGWRPSQPLRRGLDVAFQPGATAHGRRKAQKAHKLGVCAAYDKP